MTEENKVKITTIINSLAARGGTDIALGMSCAFDQIKQRVHQN
jgi:secreted protein with Ig-like and vWFA domain